MNANRFDAVARSVNALRSRRSLIGLAAGGVLGLANLRQGDDAPLALARKKRRKKRRKACPKTRRCGKKCCRGTTRCRQGVCRKPQTPPGDATPVRRNIHSLSAAQLETLARGVGVMQARNEADPTSWAAQVRRHRDYAMHGNYHFLPWHRMFLYHFEQILRDAAGDQTLTLPYWSPTPATSGSSAVLPAPFRTPGNPLYRVDRNSTVNNGEVPPTYSWFDTWSTLNIPQFLRGERSAGFGGNSDLAGSLEFGQHDNLHGWVGAYGPGDGAMARTATSPEDPIFWLHHANIDRLWEAWLRQPGRANPTSDAEFMDRPFQFFDRTGQEVTMTGRQVLDVVRQLNYRYDDQPPGGNPNAAKVTVGAQAAIISVAEPRSLAIATAPGRSLGPTQVAVPGVVKQGAAARFRTVKQANGPVRLTLRGVATTGVTGVLYEIHVGKTRPNPSAKHPSYVGIINPFTVEVASHGGHGGHHGGGSADFTFDITRAVASGGGVKRVMVTLVPISLSGSTSPPPGPWITVDQFVIEVNAGSAGAGVKGKKRKPNGKQSRSPQAKPLPKRRKQQDATRRRRLGTRRRQQQRQQAPSATRQPPAAHASQAGDAVSVPEANRSSFFAVPGTGGEPVAAPDHAHH